MKKFTLLLMIASFAVFLLACQNTTNEVSTDVDFSTWNQEKLYAYLDEVAVYASEINSKTYTDKLEITSLYEKYFTPELSATIVDELFILQNGVWTILMGDPGYILIRPSEENLENNQVDLQFEKTFIQMRVTYEIGLHSKIEYLIENQNGPKISKWVFE